MLVTALFMQPDLKMKLTACSSQNIGISSSFIYGIKGTNIPRTKKKSYKLFSFVSSNPSTIWQQVAWRNTSYSRHEPLHPLWTMHEPQQLHFKVCPFVSVAHREKPSRAANQCWRENSPPAFWLLHFRCSIYFYKPPGEQLSQMHTICIIIQFQRD